MPGEGDPVQDVLQVALGRGTRAGCRDVAALFADHVGLLVRVEGDAGVEVGEDQMSPPYKDM